MRRLRSLDPRLPPRRAGRLPAAGPLDAPAPAPTSAEGTAGRSGVPLIWTKIAWGLGFGLVVLGLLWVLRPVFAILAASAGISYVLTPILGWMMRRGLSREQAIGLIFVGSTTGFVLIVLLFVPGVIRQLDELSGRLIPFLHDLEAQLIPAVAWLNEQTGQDIQFDLSDLRTRAPALVAEQWPKVQERVGALSRGLFTQGLGLLNAILNLTLLPIFVYYLLQDWDRAIEGIAGLIPPRYLPRIERVAREVDGRLSAFVRGQLTVCGALSFLYSVGLLIVGIDLAVPIGVLSGVLFIVPYLGTAVGIVLASVLAMMKFGFGWEIVQAIAVFVVVQGIEGYLLTPRIVGDKVGLHPLVVMVALLVGGSLLGIWGMFLAIPLTAVLSVFAAEWLSMYKRSHAYSGAE
jgi:predicted PurR-regulated permease PerM